MLLAVEVQAARATGRPASRPEPRRTSTPVPPAGWRSGNAPECAITNVNVGGAGTRSKPAAAAAPSDAYTGLASLTARAKSITGAASTRRAPAGPTRSTRRRRARSFHTTRSDDALAGLDPGAHAARPAARGEYVASPNDELVELRALQEEVQVVLPREADAAVHLERRAMTRFDASEHHVFAVDAAIDASGSPAPMHHAAQ